MQDHAMRMRTGAGRLFGKFLLVLVPIYLVCSTLGLSYIGQRAISDDKVALEARIANRSGFIADTLARRQGNLDTSAGEILETLLSDTAIACAEVIGTAGATPLLAVPSGSGCGGLQADAVVELPVGADGERALLVRYRSDEIREMRSVRRQRAAIAILLGLLIAIGANYLAFRLLIGRRVGELLGAIRRTGETGSHEYVAVEGRDELTEVARAYNEMQSRLEAESGQVRRQSRELEAEIGQRRKAENAALAAKQAAEDAAAGAIGAAQSAEMASRAKSAFLAMMSHELRTPLNCILGFADILIRQTGDEDTRAHLKLMKSSGESLLVIVGDLLDLSMIESGKLEIDICECALRAVVELSVRMLSVKAREKGLSLSMHFGADVPEVAHTDPHRLKQILTNLINNAIKFTNRGGVSIEVGREIAPSGADTVVLAVRDTGIGIPEEFRSHMFERFSQAETTSARRYEGTGLGLAICRDLVTMMGGEIAVRSEVGHGSAFTVRLPLRARKPGPTPLFLTDPETDHEPGRKTATA
jgi:signal transduction histidine kinase